jgi:hypothetical protein
MKSGGDNKNLLASWKEIAAYLNCDVRTCIRYEKQHRLPVFRIGKGNKSRVYAYKEELDKWLNNQTTNKQVSLKSFLGSPAIRLLLFAVSLPFFVIILMKITPGKSHDPAYVEFVDKTLRISDIKDRYLWSYEFNHKINRDYSRSYGFFDISGGRSKELLVVITPKGNSIRTSRLYCFSARGRILWKYKPGKEVQTRSEIFTDIYLIPHVSVHTAGNPDQKFIIVGANHSPDYPYQIALLNPSGNKIGEFWNSGHINKKCIKSIDLDGDGCREIVMGGVNNGHKCACLIVLDPLKCMGTSPQRETPDYEFLGFPRGSEKYYLLFPRSPLSRLFSERNRVEGLYISDERQEIDITISEYNDGTRDYMLVYTFDFGLNIIRVSPEDYFLAKVKELYTLGRIPESAETSISDYERYLKYWDGAAWTNTASSNDVWQKVLPKSKGQN